MQNILLVDDDRDLLLAMKISLKRHGYTLTTLLEPSDIEAVIDEIHPAIVILDINMGDWDGRKVCKSLKENPAYQNIPVVLYSSLEEEAAAVKDCKADLFLKKPLTAKMLAEQLNQLVQV